MQGESFKPLLEKGDVEWRNSIFYSYYENSWALRDVSRSEMSDPSFNYFTAHRIGPHRGVRTDRFKLIEFYSKSDYWEFFDLEKDPNEVRNAYTDPEYASEIAELKIELRRLQKQYKDIGVWERLTLPDYR
jgi:arylsulfatase A-like enzyme